MNLFSRKQNAAVADAVALLPPKTADTLLKLSRSDLAARLAAEEAEESRVARQKLIDENDELRATAKREGEIAAKAYYAAVAEMNRAFQAYETARIRAAQLEGEWSQGASHRANRKIDANLHELRKNADPAIGSFLKHLDAQETAWRLNGVISREIDIGSYSGAKEIITNAPKVLAGIEALRELRRKAEQLQVTVAGDAAQALADLVAALPERQELKEPPRLTRSSEVGRPLHMAPGFPI